MSRPVITLVTDFGQVDSYVGTMKGVILGICPEATLVDICHDIRPQAVREADFVLSTAAPYFPPGTIHLVVVDPGVGTARRPIVVLSKRATYVAPDNGVLSTALLQDPARQAVHLSEPRYQLNQVSSTFHGRDIFAPAAAHLAQGTEPKDMGDPIPLKDLVMLHALKASQQPDGSWSGRVIHIDRFGNLITNLRPEAVGTPVSILVEGNEIPTRGRTFADVGPGECVTYVGSSGYLEIAVRNGNAAEQLDIGIDASVIAKSKG